MADKPLIDLSVAEIAGSPFCVTSVDGEALYARLAECLRQGGTIRISFDGVKTLASAFLNSAIGQLYTGFPHPTVDAGLEVCDIGADDLALLRRTIETAKEFSRDPARFRRAAREVLEDDAYLEA